MPTSVDLSSVGLGNVGTVFANLSVATLTEHAVRRGAIRSIASAFPLMRTVR